MLKSKIFANSFNFLNWKILRFNYSNKYILYQIVLTKEKNYLCEIPLKGHFFCKRTLPLDPFSGHISKNFKFGVFLGQNVINVRCEMWDLLFALNPLNCESLMRNNIWLHICAQSLFSFSTHKSQIDLPLIKITICI